MAGASDATALVLKMSADNAQILKGIKEVTTALKAAGPEWQAHGKKAAHELEKGLTGEGFGAAFKKVFDSSKLAVIEEGSAKLRIFGSALEPLGALGIGAAAGIAALGLALEEAHKAVEFADSLYKLALNAHVSTDALQEFQYALRVSGGNAADASGALQSFSATLGKAQAGLPKAQKAFLELGFSKAQIKGFADAGTAMDAVVEKIAGLKSTAQKDAVIQQLGLEQMKPLIEAGAEKMREFRAEAEASGNVMDAHLIKKGHELNEEIETATGKIKVQLSEAFVNIGPVLVKLLGILAQMAEYAEKVSAALSPIEARGTTDLNRELIGLQNRQKAGGLAGALYKSSDAANIPRIQAELARRKASGEDAPPKLPTGGGSLIDQTKTHAKADQTDSFDKAARDAYDTGLKALIEAQKALTANIQERADAETKAINADLDKKLTDLSAKEAEIRKSKNDANKAEQLALIEKAKTEEQNAAAAKIELVNRQADFAQEDQLDETRKQLVDATITQLTAAAAQATTAAERTQIERDILKLKQDEYAHELGKQLSRQVQTGEISQDVADQRFGAGLSTQKTERQQFDLSHEDPIQKYLRSLQDLDTEMKTEAVTALDGLAGGIADIVANGAKAGDVLRSLIRTLLADWTKMIVQQGETSILGKLGVKIPGAGGSAAAASMSTAITTGGTTAATAMGTAITTAGAAVAAELAAAMAAGGASGGGGLGFVSSLLGGAGGGFGSAADIGSSFDFGLQGLAFANGTDSAPGGMSLVGENGPEIVNLPRGAQVIPNDVMRGLTRTGGQAGGSSFAWNGDVNVHAGGAMTPADARRTGRQISTELRKQMSKGVR